MKNMETNNSISQSFLVLATGELFENMMGIAKGVFSRNYESYSDFEEDFYNNINTWEPLYVEQVWSAFAECFENRYGHKVFDELTYEGRFFEQVDYVFVFVYKVTGKHSFLVNIAKSLIEWKHRDVDGLCMVISDMQNHFRPSYSGENKNDIWADLGVPGISWPPRILT